jgi:hypothetical protein
VVGAVYMRARKILLRSKLKLKKMFSDMKSAAELPEG